MRVARAAGRSTRASRTDRIFTGKPVSLEFEGADLRAVLRIFAEISGLNVVIDPAVRGTVDVAMRDVPWDQALDVILRANKLGYVLDGTIVRVAPLAALAEEEKGRRKLAEEQALSGELRISTRTLNYAKADDVARLVTKSALTPRGTVQVDPRTNTLVLSDLQPALDRALTIVAALDAPQPQVEIEARIVQTSRDFARTIGVQWGLGGRVAADLGNTTPLAFPNSGSITGRTGRDTGAVGDTHGRGSRHRDRHHGNWPRARGCERGLQPRCGPDGARARGTRAPVVDAACCHTEQRGG